MQTSLTHRRNVQHTVHIQIPTYWGLGDDLVADGEDLSRQLQSQVRDAIQSYEPYTFERLWALSSNVISRFPIRSFYLSVDDGYGNVAILTDELLIDIEGEDEDPPGTFSIQRMSAISGIEFFEGPVEDLPDTEEANLVILAFVAGSEVVDRYWVAYTDDERDDLLHFGKTLVESITQS